MPDQIPLLGGRADAKNYTKTGKQVNLSQSAVSMQIKRLENEVGKKCLTGLEKQ